MNSANHKNRQRKHAKLHENYCGFCANRIQYYDGVARYGCKLNKDMYKACEKHSCKEFIEK